MTWEYSRDPATSTKDEVRFLIGDTDEGDPQLQDEEIDYLLTEYGSPVLAAAVAAGALAAKFTRLVDKAVGDLRISLSQRMKQYRELAEDLSTKAGGAGATVPAVAFYVGGISISEKRSDDLDPDLVRSSFEVGMHDRDADRARRRRKSDPDYGTAGSDV